jgi:membrane protein
LIEEQRQRLEDEVETLSRGWRPVLRSTLTHMKMNRVNIAAGAFAYRWFLAIFPIIIALLGIATLVTVPRSVVINLLNGVTKALPSGAAQVFTGAISHATQRSAADLITTVVACVVALWSATSGMVIVEEGLDMAYDLPLDRSFLGKRAVALPLLLGATVFGSAASALIIFGPQLGNVIKETAPIGGTAFSAVWTILRFVIALALMNFLMTLLYYLAPNRPRSRWRWMSPGALIATILWAIVSFGFSIYTSNFGSYGRTYGAFAGVAILIFWLYLTGLAILIGGEVDAAVERLAAPAQPPAATPPATPPSSE